MEVKVKRLRDKYDSFKKGEENLLAVRDEVQLMLAEAMKGGNQEILEEVENMLIDLALSIEENKCKCHRKC